MPFPLDDIARLGAGVPVLADVEPSGSQLMPDFDAGGGVPSLLREISGLLDLDAMTIAGQSIGEITAAAPAGQRRDQAGQLAAARGRRLRRRPGHARAGRRGDQDLGGERAT